jgi:monoamine oxidase
MPTLFTALRAHRKPRKRRAVAEPAIPGGAPLPGAPGYTAEMVAVAARKAKGEKKRQVGPTRKMSLRDRFMVRRKATPRTVVVVGGGFAGLAAAYELESVGYEVVVLEGQEEVGGRVESRRDIVSGDVVEAGAELIGRNHPAWWSYKRKFDLHLRRLSDPADPPVYLDGQRVSGAKAEQLNRQLDSAQRRINHIARHINAHQPWKSRVAKKLDRLSLLEALKRMRMSSLCRLAFIELLQSDNGVMADKQSWLGNLAMIKGGGLSRFWTDTETHHCVEGNQALAFAFKKALKQVFFDAKVGSVKVGQSGVTVLLKNEKETRKRKKRKKKKAEKSKRKFEADDVVIAIPPTMLKRVGFRPPLPPAYYSGQFGNNIKFLMDVRNGSWKPEAPNFSSDGPVDLTWDGTDRQGGPRAGLVAFSGADDAMRVRSWSKKRFLKELGVVYPRLGSSCGKGVMMDWPRNKWTKGSYSFPKPGEVTRVGPLLRSGYLGRVHFAGEHTCYAFTGYMEAALQSGIRVAEQIAKRDGVLGKRRRRRLARHPAKLAPARAADISTGSQTP